MSQMQIGERTFTIGCIRDISGRKAYTEALEHRTLHDELTGLPNRALFGDRMDRAIADADRAGEPRGVLLVDLDEFRMINETLGRENGDRVLKTVAERLRTAVRNSDTVARLGGDEFGILPSDETDVETAEAIAWKVRAAFEEPFLIDGQRPSTCARASGSRSSRSTAARPPTCCAAPRWRCARPSRPAAASASSSPSRRTRPRAG